MKSACHYLPAILAISSTFLAAGQVPVTGPGHPGLKDLEGSPTLVTVVIKGERTVEDPNLTIKQVLPDAINVETKDGEQFTYLFDSIAEVRVQGDVVEKAPIRLPLAGALRSEDQQIVERAAVRARELFGTASDNQEIKLDAAAIIHLHDGASGNEATKYLEQLLAVDDVVTQVEAGERVYLAGDDVSEQLVLSGLQSGNRKVRVIAIELAGLTKFQDATPMLIQSLNDRSADLSAPAALALARLGNREVIPRLLNMLRESSAEKGDAAADALILLGGQDILEQMHMMLPEATMNGRFRIIKVMNGLGDREARRLLQETVQNVPTLALDAAVLLAQQEDEFALDFLRRRLSERMDETEENFLLRARIAAALIEGGDPGAIGEFQNLLRVDMPTVKVAVCDKILEIGDRRLLVLLQPIISNADPAVATHACMAAMGFAFPEYRNRTLAMRG